MRATIWMSVVAAGVAGMLSTVWLRPVEAKKPQPAAGPCADEAEVRMRARQVARLAERETAEARAAQQGVRDRLREIERDRAQVDQELARAHARRMELQRVISPGGVIDDAGFR